MITKITDHLKQQITKWKDNLNNHYKTDGGHSLEEYAKGALEAHIHLLTFINDQEKKDGRLTEEAERIRNEVLTNDGCTQQEGAYIQ
tara:strand:- start:259 stop:519 length:261 start_codon:yes stop_codon:yes gene_type:complete